MRFFGLILSVKLKLSFFRYDQIGQYDLMISNQSKRDSRKNAFYAVICHKTWNYLNLNSSFDMLHFAGRIVAFRAT
jgi:hypothetical protein